MLKKERLQWILEKVNAKGVITVNDVIKELGVSDMTVRRDLDELDKDGLLIRIHGGAQSIDSPKIRSKHEKSNTEKLSQQVPEKREIASLASKTIQDGETIFIGPGTTLEYFAKELRYKSLRIVTNSLPVFNILKDCTNIDLLLIGGEYRPITGAFVGTLASSNIKSLKFSKAFISANGIFKNSVATYSESEGIIQQLALDQSLEKILLVDHQKFDAYDFYVFYDTNKFDKIITDSMLSDNKLESYSSYTKIIRASNK